MKLSYKKRILLSFTVASLLLLTVGISVFSSFGEMRKQNEWVDHTYQVIGTVSDLLSEVKDVQSAQRGFVITGMEDYLMPYHNALPIIAEDLVLLETLVADNPKQVERYNNLKMHVLERLEIANMVIDTYRKEGQQKTIELIKKGSGKREMDQIRAIVAEMQNEEENLLQKRRAALKLSSNITNMSGLVGLGICFLILTIVFYLINREAEQRAATEANLQDALGQMEVITHETKLIGKVGDYLRGCRNEDEAYDIIRTNMPTLFPGTYGSISIFNNSRNMLQNVLHWGDLPNISKEFEPEDCWALRQGRVHESLNDGVSPMCGHLSKIEGKSCSICLPMQAQGETLGQIYIGSKETHHMSEHQLATLRSVGEQVSLALANLKLQRALKEQSIKDPLTKLFNRRYLEETLIRETARAQRSSQTMAAMIMDLDHFKKVNDTYGHEAGDAVLVAFSKLLLTKIRKEDIACRLGGEEFVLILPSAGEELAIKRAGEICEATRQIKINFQGQSIKISVSIGIAMYPALASTSEELLQNADAALYKAKHGGRDRAVLYDPSMAMNSV